MKHIHSHPTLAKRTLIRESSRAFTYVGALASVLSAGNAWAQCTYQVTFIQGPVCPQFGLPPTYGLAINGLGEVAGYYELCLSSNRSYKWSPEMDLVTLTTPAGISSSAAFDLNDNGWVVGELDDPSIGTVGFVYDGIQVINLGALPGGTYSPALGINNSGQVVGLWGNNITGPLPLAYFWQKDQMIDISSDFGTPKSRANAINDFGQATGWMGSNAATNGNAFIWQNGQVTTLPHLPGGYRSEGLGINNLGHVVGTSRIGIPNGANQVHATAWIDGAPIDLGTFPGFITSAADDINDSGAIVGRSWNSGGNPNISRACIWQNDVMTDLNDLVPPNLGMTIYRATAINNAGQIAGTAQTLQFDVLAVLLTPKAPQLGDLNSDCTVGITDFLTLLAAWGPCLPGASCAEDLDGDSNVGIGDFLVLLANWG